MDTTQTRAPESARSAPPEQAQTKEPKEKSQRGKLRGVGYADGAAMLRPGAAGDGPTDITSLVQRFGAQLGADLSHVRVHLGSAAPAAVGATAYARKEEVHLAIGAAELQGKEGQRLLAHELTHIVQQRRGVTATPEASAEREADGVADRLAEGRPANVAESAGGGATLHKKVGLLTGAQESAATAYNKAQGYAKATVKKWQSMVGTGADGLFGPKTAEAIARFQSGRGLGVDGCIGPKTRGALEGEGQAPPPGAPAPAPTPGVALGPAQVQAAIDWYEVRSPLYPKSVVKQIQAKAGAEADGYIGPKTVKAVASWQKSHGLYSDGMAGTKTVTAMFGNDIRPKPEPGSEQEPGPTEMAFQRPHGLSQLKAVFGSPGKNIGTFAMRAGAGGKMINVPCHKKVGPIFQAVFQDIWNAGLSSHIHSYDGCYVYRTKRKNSSSWSTHAWGIAMDINASSNPMVGSKAPPKVSDSQKILAPWFEKHGFYWGAAFGDAMHFQYATGY